MKINSMGTCTVSTEFIPLFPPSKLEFKPLVIRQFDYEDKEIKTKEPVYCTSYQAQSGITQEDQQATSQEAK